MRMDVVHPLSDPVYLQDVAGYGESCYVGKCRFCGGRLVSITAQGDHWGHIKKWTCGACWKERRWCIT